MTQQLDKEAHAAAELVKNLSELGDEELTADMVEGETEFFECLDRVMQEIAADEALARGAAEMASQLSERARMAKKRTELHKAAIETAMMTAGLSGPFRRPGGTLTLKSNPPTLGDFEESEVPSQFFAQQPPKLDRKALLKAVKDGELDGVALKPASYSLQIRRV